MVVPGLAGGPGAQGLLDAGPTTPAELQPRLRKVKWVMVSLVASLLVKLITFACLVPAAAFGFVFNSISTILVVIIGVFLLKDDQLFSKPYECLQRCCACPGGVHCLCAFFFFCCVTAITGLLPIGGSDMQFIITFIMLMTNPSKKDEDIKWGLPLRSSAWFAFSVIFVIASVIALLAQVVGAYHGYKGYQQFQEIQMGGMMDWPPARDMRDRPPLHQGMGGAPGPSPGVAFPGAPAPQQGPAGASAPPQQPPGGCPPQQGFQTFGGQGHRLAD